MLQEVIGISQAHLLLDEWKMEMVINHSIGIWIYIYMEIYMVNIWLIFSEIFDVINHRAIGIIYI